MIHWNVFVIWQFKFVPGRDYFVAEIYCNKMRTEIWNVTSPTCCWYCFGFICPEFNIHLWVFTSSKHQWEWKETVIVMLKGNIEMQLHVFVFGHNNNLWFHCYLVSSLLISVSVLPLCSLCRVWSSYVFMSVLLQVSVSRVSCFALTVLC